MKLWTELQLVLRQGSLPAGAGAIEGRRQPGARNASVRQDDAASGKFLDNHVGQCFRRMSCTVEMDLRILGRFVR
jgi:hypothetical protein